jgi:hypothetical protein
VELLQEAYQHLVGERYCSSKLVAEQEVKRMMETSHDLFTCFSLPRVREARFHRLISGDARKATKLLQQQLDEEVRRAVTSKPVRLPIKTFGKAARERHECVGQELGPEGSVLAHTVLARHVEWLPSVVAKWKAGDFRNGQLLPVLMDLVETACECGGATGGDDYSSGVEKDAVAMLAVQAQHVWERSSDKKCCSYRLNSSRDTFSPLLRLCFARVNAGMAGAISTADIVRVLLEHKASVNQGRKDTGVTPLHMACKKGHESVVRVLLEHKASVNQGSKDTGAMPLHMACVNDHVAVVRMLLASGADTQFTFNLPGGGAATLTDVAKAGGLLEILDILTTHVQS